MNVYLNVTTRRGGALRKVPVNATELGLRKALALLDSKGGISSTPIQSVRVSGPTFLISIGHGYIQPMDFWVDFLTSIEE